MAHANVSNSVLTIIASFSNGLDVLKKLRRSEKKGTRPSRKSRRDDENALRLSHSLRHGPEDIGREYQAGSMHCDSEQYAMGDAVAQTSLAEILLKLNTGLVGIITSFLNRDKKNGLDLDYHSLTDLSEQSRVQTIGVLRQLYQRLMSRRIPPIVSRTHSDKPKSKKQDHRTSNKFAKTRRPTLARVMIENSSIPSQIAMIRQSETRKQRSTTHSRSSSEAPKPKHGSTPAMSTPDLPTQPPPYFPSDPLPKHTAMIPNKPPRHKQSSTSLLKPRTLPKHDPSMPTPFDGLTPLGGLMYSKADLTSPISRPNFHNLARSKSQRLRPDTFYSIGSARTGSTKLGEIPMQKWAEPWNYEAAEKANEEALASGWPNNVGEEMAKVKTSGWKRWFGKRVQAR